MANDVVRYYRIRNWDRFQHYKNRRPVWIKLYLSLCDDQDFVDLPDHAKVQLMSMWIFAAKRQDNSIPDRGRVLENHNMSHEPLDLPLLVNAGFLELVEEKTDVSPANGNASNLLATCYPREEKRREESTYAKERITRGRRAKFWER